MSQSKNPTMTWRSVLGEVKINITQSEEDLSRAVTASSRRLPHGMVNGAPWALPASIERGICAINGGAISSTLIIPSIRGTAVTFGTRWWITQSTTLSLGVSFLRGILPLPTTYCHFVGSTEEFDVSASSPRSYNRNLLTPARILMFPTPCNRIHRLIRASS